MPLISLRTSEFRHSQEAPNMNSRTKFFLTVSSLLTVLILILGVYKTTAQRHAGTKTQERVIVKNQAREG